MYIGRGGVGLAVGRDDSQGRTEGWNIHLSEGWSRVGPKRVEYTFQKGGAGSDRRVDHTFPKGGAGSGRRVEYTFPKGGAESE